MFYKISQNIFKGMIKVLLFLAISEALPHNQLLRQYLIFIKSCLLYLQRLQNSHIFQQKMKANPLRIILLAIGTSYTIKAANLTKNVEEAHEQELIETFSFEFWLFTIISIGLSCFAGICSGLTVGYMSISKAQMELMAKSENQSEKKMAKPILQILNNHHFLLSTLLLANALSLEALPIFLDKLVPPFVAVVISVIAVVILGEVIPQAYCTGHHKVTIGYYFAPFVRALQCVFYPFVKPIVYILDKLIEHDEGKIVLTRKNLKTVLSLHNKKQYGYRDQEMEILQNILDLRLYLIGDVMIPLSKVYMLDQSTRFNEKIINQLMEMNYSKIPIYRGFKQKVIGYLRVKNLFQMVNSGKITLQQNKIIAPVVEINEKKTLLDAIDILKTKKINFAIVTNDKGVCKGIVTLKQIFEKIVLKEFKDDDIRAHIEMNKEGVQMNKVIEAQEQD